MITTSFLLGSLSVLGFYLIYRKLPNWTKEWMNKHSLFTDATACFLTYLLFGTTVTGLFASAISGILVSIMLAARKNPLVMDYVKRLAETYKGLVAKIEGRQLVNAEVTT